MGIILMEWILSTEFTIEEANTGFIITLLSGSWSEPLNLKTKAPDGMGPQGQALYLRLGLEFAKTFMSKRLKYSATDEFYGRILLRFTRIGVVGFISH